MKSPDGDQDDISRRSFLASSGGLVTGMWVAVHWPSIAAAAHHADEAYSDTAPPHFEFFSAGDGADVEAICAQIVPSGATPGAREARAVYFIDRSLATFFAAFASDYRRGLIEFQTKFRAANPAVSSFGAATADGQRAFLKTADSTPFFGVTRMLTVLGMFTSAKYGGNYRGLGWKLLGFVDQHVFTPPFGFYDAEYQGFVSDSTEKHA